MKARVLVVDDSVSIRQMVEMTLRSADFDVTLAEDGQHALEVCSNKAFDFVLTDQNMPRMDGLSLIRALRTKQTYQRTPIVMLTTESSDDMKQQGRAAGATGWMVKPFDPNKLIAVLGKLMSR
ncbi:response regulator [Alteromonas confluentis]|uniref:Fis family transcriptional regulator n=1 Tax=Alteromonas confluentis TaxID=1656094 RepID=A0A1E7Z7Y0_9ALTE|nr:response regulator [Alteromonas confluentis]OFC69620.1 Fis family transcriptional regulator [Alteromonas confluentis]